MTVAELIEQLERMPQDAVVVFYDVYDDEEVVLSNVQEYCDQVELF